MKVVVQLKAPFKLIMIEETKPIVFSFGSLVDHDQRFGPGRYGRSM